MMLKSKTTSKRYTEFLGTTDRYGSMKEDKETWYGR
jgi:hypothetical protein